MWRGLCIYWCPLRSNRPTPTPPPPAVVSFPLSTCTAPPFASPWSSPTPGAVVVCPLSPGALTILTSSADGFLLNRLLPHCLPYASSQPGRVERVLTENCCLLFIPPSFCLPQGEDEVEMGEENQHDESGLLTIHNVTRAHAGLYQCTANNDIASPATVTIQLVVQC